MIECLKDANHWTAIVAFLWLGNSIFEYWIGKTDKTKAASTWELLFVTIVSIGLFLSRRNDGKGTIERG